MVTEATDPRARLDQLRAMEQAKPEAPRERLNRLRQMEAKTEIPAGGRAYGSPQVVREGRETRATEELPEMTFSGLLAGEDPMKIAQVATALVATTNPREVGAILSKSFPNIGITEDEKGNIMANNNANGVQAVIDKPGMSPINLIQTLGIASLFIPGANLATATTGLAGKAAVGGLAAGVTQGSIEALQQELGGEMDVDEIAIATALGGAAELALPAIQALRSSRLQGKAASSGQTFGDIKNNIAVADEVSRATGVDFYPAQKTMIPSDLRVQSFLPELPASTTKASAALAKQNGQVSAAVNDFLNMLAPPESIITGPRKFRSAAEAAIKAKKAIREQRASPLYKSAYEMGKGEFDVAPVMDFIDSRLKVYPPGGQVATNLEKVKGYLKTSDTLEQLHHTKIELDEMISSTMDTTIGDASKRELFRLKKRLLRQMEADNASPLYKQARLKFEAESPDVNLVEGMFGKVEKLNDDQLKTISRRIFDPMETNPEVMLNAKKVITDIDPSAWRELARNEIERRMGSIRSTMEAGTTENVPGQIYNAVFGNTKQRKVLFNAFDGEAKKNLHYLQTALNRARSGRVVGSPTAGREEMMKDVRSVGTFVRELVTSPIATTVNIGAEASTNANIRALADVFFDPKWAPRMKELRALNIDSPAAARALAQLIDDSIKADLDNLESIEFDSDDPENSTGQ